MSESSVISARSTLTLEECRAVVSEALPVLGAESVSLAGVAGRVLADDVAIGVAFPPFASSAMDGWAVALDPDAAFGGFRVIGESRAGSPFAGELEPGEAVTISTGAIVPQGAYAVVPLEDALPGADDGELAVAAPPEQGAFVREAGRYAEPGDVVCAGGSVIDGSAIAAIAAAGHAEVSCRVRPRVTVITGGDELVAPGEPIAEGELFDANSPMVAALCLRAGAVVDRVFYGSDDPAGIRDLVEQAIATSDVVVACGGMSVGPHDHLREVFARLGAEERVPGVAMRPGRKFWFGVAPAGSGRETALFGLPGNPVSAFACTQLIVRHALGTLVGRPPVERRWAQLAVPVAPLDGVTRVVAGSIEGRYALRVFVPSGGGSDDAVGLAGASAVALVRPGAPTRSGELVEVETFDG